MDEIFNRVADSVMELMDVNYYDMLTSNEQRFVDARALLVAGLVLQGLPQRVIAEMTGLTRQGVNKLANSLDDRLRYNATLRYAWKELCNELATR